MKGTDHLQRTAAMQQNLVHIGEVIVHGIVFDPKNEERLRTMDLNELLKSIPRLFDLLDDRKIDYVLVGGIAMLVYVDGRNRQNIDLIAPREALEKLPEITIEDDNEEFARGWFGDLRVDFLFTSSKLFDEVRKSYSTKRRFAERDIPCATVEGLLLLKLFALPSLYRQMQFAKVETYEHDVRVLLRKYEPDLPPLVEELEKHMLESDADELRKIVADIEGQIARAGERFKGDAK